MYLCERVKLPRSLSVGILARVRMIIIIIASLNPHMSQCIGFTWHSLTRINIPNPQIERYHFQFFRLAFFFILFHNCIWICVSLVVLFSDSNLLTIAKQFSFLCKTLWLHEFGYNLYSLFIFFCFRSENNRRNEDFFQFDGKKSVYRFRCRKQFFYGFESFASFFISLMKLAFFQLLI